MATKRRRVWVTYEEDDAATPAWVEASARQANINRTSGETKAVPFVERLPGDVVLSREDVARALALLDEVACAYADGDDKRKLRVLLRGRR